MLILHMYLMLISLKLLKTERKSLNWLFQVLNGNLTPLDGTVTEVLSVIHDTELLRQLSV